MVWCIFQVGAISISLPYPPLNFTSSQLGLVQLAAVVGSMVGSIICGLVSDPPSSVVARHNKGIREPESRLYLALPQIPNYRLHQLVLLWSCHE